MHPDKMEGPEFDAPVCFHDCQRNTDPLAECECEEIEREIRADFAAVRYELERGN